MAITTTIVSVPKVTEAEASAAKLKLGALARFSYVPTIDNELDAVTRGMEVAARRCIEQNLGAINGVEKVTYDENAAQWNITYSIVQ